MSGATLLASALKGDALLPTPLDSLSEAASAPTPDPAPVLLDPAAVDPAAMDPAAGDLTAMEPDNALRGRLVEPLVEL